MPLLPFIYKRVSDRLRIRVTNHYFHSDFGIRNGADPKQYGRRYVCSGTPGTGFVERESNSHSYHEFVRSHASVQPPSYLRMATGREPSYDRELARANAALHAEQDPVKRQLLECYTNALTVGRSAEYMQRVVAGVKSKMGHRQNRYMESVISRYKRKIAQLEKDMQSVEYHVEQHHTPEVLEAYGAMCGAFTTMVRRCRRIWHYNERSRDHFVQVFFDMGIFDFIRADDYLPLMRDSLGRTLYLLPDTLLVARSSVDFDLLPLKGLTIVWQEMAMEEPTELLSAHLVDAACMIQIPALAESFYFNHAHVVIDFVKAVDRLKATL